MPKRDGRKFGNVRCRTLICSPARAVLPSLGFIENAWIFTHFRPNSRPLPPLPLLLTLVWSRCQTASINHAAQKRRGGRRLGSVFVSLSLGLDRRAEIQEDVLNIYGQLKAPCVHLSIHSCGIAELFTQRLSEANWPLSAQQATLFFTYQLKATVSKKNKCKWYFSVSFFFLSSFFSCFH